MTPIGIKVWLNGS